MKTKKINFDWSIFIAVMTICVVIVCGVVCCCLALPSNDNGIAKAQENESDFVSLNRVNFNVNSSNQQTVLYMNQYADFYYIFDNFLSYIDFLGMTTDDAFCFEMFNFGEYFGSAYFLSYPDDNTLLFVVSTDDGILNDNFRLDFPTYADFYNYIVDFARFYVLMDNNSIIEIGSSDGMTYTQENFSINATYYTSWSGFDNNIFTSLFSADGRFTDFNGNCQYLPINYQDNFYINARVTSGVSSSLIDFYEMLSQSADTNNFFNNPIYSTGETGGRLAIFYNDDEGSEIELFYSPSMTDFLLVFGQDYYESLFDGTGNFGYVNNMITQGRFNRQMAYEFYHTYTLLDAEYFVDDIDFQSFGYNLDWGMVFSSTYNFLNVDDVKYLHNIDVLETRIDGLQSSVDGMQSTIELLYEEIHNLRESNQNYFDSINGENGYISQINSLNAQLSTANNTIQNLNSQIVALQDEISTLQDEISTLHGNNDNLTNQISQLQQQIDELNAELQEVTRERDEYYVFYQQLSWSPFVDSNYNNLKTAYFDGMKTTIKAVYDIGGGNVGVMLIDDSGTVDGLIGFLGFGQIIQSGRVMKISWKDLRIQYQTGSSGDGGFLPVHIAVMSGDSLIDVYVTNEETMIDGSFEFTLPVDADGLYFYNSEATTYLFISGLVGYMNQYDGEVIYQNGYDAGVVDGQQYGEQIGYENGYSDAREYYINNDFSFFALISSVLDAPLQMIIGTDEKPGMLNFYIPGLDINIAPFLLSLFSVALVITVIRFILARAS